jgi:hypothetical protein
MRLFGFEEGWARAVLAAMFPVEDPAREHAYGGGFASIIAAAPFEAGVGLRLALCLVMLSPLFVLGRARLFTGLEPEAKERLLDALLGSSTYAVRQLVLALKTMGALLYARDPKVRRQLLTPRTPAVPGEKLVTLSAKKEASRAA